MVWKTDPSRVRLSRKRLSMNDSMEHHEWPTEPYKGLANYEGADQRLFAGRDVEIDTCAQLLANAQTKLLILHGQTGCGKSSFLRAGLIPALEQNGAAYMFLRRQSPASPGGLIPSFIRCGADPLARIAEEIFLSTSQPLTIRTATGTKPIDLSSARLGIDRLDQFVAKCADPYQLCRSLEQLTNNIPHTFVLVLDQVEEVITLNQSNTNNRSRFARFIKELAASDIDMRFILAIRKDHSGQFIGSIQVDNEISVAFKTYFLADLSRSGIREAILRPTLKSQGQAPARQAPFDCYQFEYAEGIVERILDDLDELIPAGATLPVMQIVCRDLYDQARRLSAPRLIEMHHYTQGEGIKGRVKRHLTAALRDVLKTNGGGKFSDELELKWLLVLKRLVQEEGDGRVHTDVVPKSSLQDWATDAGIAGDIGPVIDRLTDPKILILRRFTVFAPGVNTESELLCLGHDMIGIALCEALRDAESKQLVQRVLKKRFRQLYRVCAIIAGIGILTTVYMFREDAKRTQQLVNGLMAQTAANRTTSALDAMASAKQAQEISEGLFTQDGRPRLALAGLLSGLPLVVMAEQSAPPLDERNFIYPTYVLSKRTGFATLRSNGILETYTVADKLVSRRKFSTPPLLNARDGKLALQSLELSDATPELVLAMYTPSEQGGKAGVVAFAQSREPKLFTHQNLIDALRTTSSDGARLDILGLSGDSIILYRLSDNRASIHLKSVRVSESGQLVAGIGKEDETVSAMSIIAGHHLLSFIPAGKLINAVPSSYLASVESRDLAGMDKPRKWRPEDFGVVNRCLQKLGAKQRQEAKQKQEAEQTCDMTSIPDLLQPDLLVLGLWETTNGRYGSTRRAFISDLVVIDLESGVPTEISLRDVAVARLTCSLAGTTPAVPRASEGIVRKELGDDDAPAFLVKGAHGFLLGYASRTYAQLIDVSAGRLSCRELFFPDIQIDGWRAAANGKKLLAFTRNGGFVWDMASVPKYDKQASTEKIRTGCTDQFPLFINREDKDVKQMEASMKSLAQLCM